MSKLITFPGSYVFVAGYDMYRLFTSKYASSLPVHGNNIAYMKTPDNLENDPRYVLEYYKRYQEKFSKESAKVTLLESPLLDSLVHMIQRYYKHKHISQDQFDYLYDKVITNIKNHIDMSSVFYIYLRYYPTNPLDPGRRKDMAIARVLNSDPMFNFRSIYSKEVDRRIERFDKLITFRLDQASKEAKFNEIIGKKK